MGVKGIVNPGFGQQSGQGQPQTGRTAEAGTPSFGALLQSRAKESQSLNFSKHAAKRLDERGIAMDTSLMGSLEHAVEEARRKGAKDVAVIGKQGVFIVNVPNNVVVTTMSQEDMKNRIMTNIDSAVLM